MKANNQKIDNDRLWEDLTNSEKKNIKEKVNIVRKLSIFMTWLKSLWARNYLTFILFAIVFFWL